MEYYKQLYAKKFNSLHKMEKFPERYKLPKPTAEEMESAHSC